METFARFFDARIESKPNLKWTVIMPDGQGDYFDSLVQPLAQSASIVAKCKRAFNRKRKRVDWETDLDRWLSGGHKINVILTHENKKGVQNWLSSHERHPDNLSIHLFDKKNTGDKKVQEMAHRFHEMHPILLECEDGTKAMYVEWTHEFGSATAYTVEAFSPLAMEKNHTLSGYTHGNSIFSNMYPNKLYDIFEKQFNELMQHSVPDLPKKYEVNAKLLLPA